MKVRTILALAILLLFSIKITSIAFADSSPFQTGLLKKICVPDEKTALVIGDTICKRVYLEEIDFEKYDINVDYDKIKDEWIVWYSFKKAKALGGGGPEIHIKRISSEVTFISLQA